MAIDHTLLGMFKTMQERYRLSGDIVTIGVQDVMFSHEDGERFFRERGYQYTTLDQASRTYRKSKAQTVYEGIFNVKNPMHMHDLFRMMGFANVASLDAFDADNPTILHDMNKPIPEQYKNKFDVVFDVGSMEHVFDVKHFVQNCVEMTKPGGTLMIYDALVGWHNECFYNFQTPFFFDIFRANGFEDISVYLNYFPKYHDFGSGKTTWLRFEYGDRPTFRKANYNTHILFIGRRAKALPEFVVPMQGYYASYYNDFVEAQAKKAGEKTEMSHYMLENMPGPVRAMFPMLVPIYRMLPNWIRTPAVDTLIHIKNRSKLAARERIRV
jgi:SAM-dependent methyltransferase